MASACGVVAGLIFEVASTTAVTSAVFDFGLAVLVAAPVGSLTPFVLFALALTVRLSDDLLPERLERRLLRGAGVVFSVLVSLAVSAPLLTSSLTLSLVFRVFLFVFCLALSVPSCRFEPLFLFCPSPCLARGGRFFCTRGEGDAGFFSFSVMVSLLVLGIILLKIRFKKPLLLVS